MDAKATIVHADIKRSKKPSKEYTKAMCQYHEYCRLGSCSDEESAIAFKSHKDELQREIIEALLFGDADPEDVHTAFGISPHTLAVYEELFFDRTKFKNKLDRLSYLENYPSKFGKELKMRSMNLGPEFILYTYANIVPRTEQQRKLVQRMFMAASYKAMAINYNAIDAKVTKNAIEHAKLMLKAWEALQKFSEDDVSEETDLMKIVTKAPEKNKSEASLVSVADII